VAEVLSSKDKIKVTNVAKKFGVKYKTLQRAVHRAREARAKTKPAYTPPPRKRGAVWVCDKVNVRNSDTGPVTDQTPEKLLNEKGKHIIIRATPKTKRQRAVCNQTMQKRFITAFRVAQDQVRDESVLKSAARICRLVVSGCTLSMSRPSATCMCGVCGGVMCGIAVCCVADRFVLCFVCCLFGVVLLIREVSEKYKVPLNAARVRAYVDRFDQTTDPQTRGGFKAPKLEPMILAAAANFISVQQLAGGHQPDTTAIANKLKVVYRAAGYPCESATHLLSKLRAAHPDCYVFAEQGNERDHRRILWVTWDNLRRWHEG
jgi:hypothetical protein